MAGPASRARAAAAPRGTGAGAGPRRAPLGVTAALVLAAAVGVLLAGQARVNGALGEQAGTPFAGSVVSFVGGLAVVAVAAGASPRARAALRGPHRHPVRWWFWLGGLGGAFVVTAVAAVTPVTGVAVVVVALVCGQTAGSLVVDRLGLPPGGPRPLSAWRLAGAGLAVVALVLSSAGRLDAAPVLPVLLVVAGGVAVTLQQAVNGRLAVATGDARVGALGSYAGGAAVLVVGVGAAVAAGLLEAPDWPDEPGLYVGGPLGAGYIITAAALVGLLGVLRLGLATVGGQLVGGVLIDVVLPVDGVEVTAATVAGAALALAAAGVASRGRQHAPSAT